MNHWTDGKLCQLVTLYSQFENLWDKTHPCYYDLRCRFDSYDEIRKNLSTPGVTVTHVLSKLWDLRNDYVAELRKVQLAKKRNSHYRPRKKWFYTMHQFFYDCLDSDEKPSEDSCATSITSTSGDNFELDQKSFEDQNQISARGNVVLVRPSSDRDSEGIRKAYSGRQNWGDQNFKSSRFGKSCVGFEDHISWLCDEANLSKCCQDKTKVQSLDEDHFSESGRRLFQKPIHKVEKNTNKFSSNGSKRGQCTSSSCFEYRHQDQEDRSSKLRTSNSRIPTSSELRRSTSRPTSEEKEKFSCCPNCYCKKNMLSKEKNSSKFSSQNSGRVSRESRCGKCNQNDHFRKKRDSFEINFNTSSSDSLMSKIDDLCEEDDDLNNINLNNAPRVLGLDELSDRVVEALNEMFVKLCPVDIACVASYCTNETCKSAKEKVTEEERDEENKEKEGSAVIETEKITNGMENRKTEDSSEGKTNSSEDGDFDDFGAEVARVLKQTNREKALRLKAAIKQTLESAKEEG